MAATQVRAGQIKDADITDADVAAANKDGTAGTPSLRTLGTGSQQAAAGNHTHTTADVPLSRATVAVDTTLTTQDMVFVTASATITLPAAATTTRRITVKNTGTGTVFVQGASGALVEGAASQSLPVQYDSIDVASDGTNWFIV